MADLTADFLDDILAESMGGKRRYNIIQNDDGTISFEDATVYSQEGSNFGSAIVNAIIQAIINLENAQIETVDPMVTTESGFAADAKLTGDAIQQCFQYASDGKTAIAEAITGMGISGVSSDMTFSELAGKLADYKALKTQTSYTIFTYGSSVPYPDLTGAFDGTWSLGSATTQAGVRTATGVTEKAIDLTNVKTLIATCSFRTTGDRTVYATFGVQQTAGTFTKSSKKSATSTGDSNTTNTISIDVSSLSGSYYLGCSLQDHTYCMSRISKIVMVMK